MKAARMQYSRFCTPLRLLAASRRFLLKHNLVDHFESRASIFTIA